MMGLSLLDALLRSKLLLSLFTCPIASGVPVQYQDGRPRLAVHGRSVHDPVFDADSADSSVIRDVDGQWYAFATEDNGKQVQAAYAPSAAGPRAHLAGHDPLPTPAPCATGRLTWAPDVHRLDNGSYLMQYNAPADNPLALGNGGACGNEDPPTHPTPIMLQEVDAADAATPGGGGLAAVILDQDDGVDGPLVEEPSLLGTRARLYVLFFSSGRFRDAGYRTNYATATDARGPNSQV
ncbi:hypothetical protein DL769_004893 [Monosporascus sp. CRB-8-3]|nr:hypothetical protein DL769_004893 [Monosporascus sp. CRB-8-3]